MNSMCFWRKLKSLGYCVALGSVFLAIGIANAQERSLSLQLGAGVPNVGFLPLYIADKAGFFAEEGLNVKIAYTAIAPQALQLVAAGQADVGWFTFEPVVTGYAKGIRGKIVAATGNALIYYIAVPEDSPIKTVADFKGKKIGVVSLGSASIPIVKSILRSAGVEIGKDQIVPVGVMDQALAALTAKQVDALSQFDAAYWAFEREGYKFRYFKHPRLADFGNAGLFITDKTVADRRQDVCGFGRAIAKASLFMVANPQAAQKIFYEVVPAAKPGDNPGAQRAALREIENMSKTLNLGRPPDAKFGAIDPAKFEQYLDVLKDEGFATEKPPVGDIVTNDFDGCFNQFDSAKIREIAKSWKQ